MTFLLNRLSGNEKDTSGGLCFLLSMITCGIYSYFWAYKMGLKRDAMLGETNGNSHLLYLIIYLFVPLVVWALIQDSINKALDN